MKKVWIKFNDAIETDERLGVVERVKSLVPMGLSSKGKTVAAYANATDQEHFDRLLAPYRGKGRPLLLQTGDADELKRILDAEFPGRCVIVDAPL